ncbi:MAG: RDD family protein [Candidatus Obscuribacterales bacterium]|nr:RDD family protein [Cyanobacteria bacterium HKST-UBA01]MCB9468833.1 RDD family protein [Candidatus Obscuribacterales bacterium]
MYTPDYSISTPENVDLHLELAGIGNRILAYLIDMTIVAMILLLLGMMDMAIYLAATYFKLPTEAKETLVMTISVVAIFVSFFLFFGYHIFFEGTWQGQSPGKRLAGIRVIENNGQPVSWSSVFIRNIVRVFDNGMMLIGLLTMLINKNEKRLGDLAAGTLVIRERKSELTGENIPMLTKAKVEPLLDIGRISTDDYDLLARFLKRRKGLSASHRPVIASRLDGYFREKLKDGGGIQEEQQPAQGNPEEFLETIFLSYQARGEEFGI